MMPIEPVPLTSSIVLSLLAVVVVNVIGLAVLAAHPAMRLVFETNVAAPPRSGSTTERSTVLAKFCGWLTCGLIFLAVWIAAARPAEDFKIAIVLASILLLLAKCDAVAYMLPNVLCLLLGLSGLAVVLLQEPRDLLPALTSMFIGGASLFAVNTIYKNLRGRDGLGMGDVKLMGAAGAWLPVSSLPSVVLMGSIGAGLYGIIIALAYQRPLANERVPFGSFLCLGIWLTWLYGPINL